MDAQAKGEKALQLTFSPDTFGIKHPCSCKELFI